ncbi:hypothetical protein AVEN_263728-1 [Araneus ventricosus]|uniref:Uncharacterized protein n=1 Tax=Araneus ventricosus TaxID=182803 RepID=A0A4Y2ATZ7_ARAVE|nr:hypothetical protein AVEN_263728-1 [Araneus ventricosus]
MPMWGPVCQHFALEARLGSRKPCPWAVAYFNYLIIRPWGRYLNILAVGELLPQFTLKEASLNYAAPRGGVGIDAPGVNVAGEEEDETESKY